MAENAVVDYLIGHGFPYAERRRLTGANDKGDIISSPGLAWEVKYAGSSTLRLSGWMKETDDEQANCGADYGILVIKPPRVGAKGAAQFLAVMRQGQFDRLLENALAGGLDWGGMAVFAHSNATTNTLCQAVRDNAKQYAYWRIQIPPRGKKNALVEDDPDGLVVTTLEQVVQLVRFAGYGAPMEAVLPFG